MDEIPECNHCQWPAKYKIWRGKGGSLVGLVCPLHLSVAVDKHNHQGRALVELIP